MYFDKQFPEDYEITSRPSLINKPIFVRPENLAKIPAPGKPLTGKAFDQFITRVSDEIATRLDLKRA